jgi:hypothetical protein
MVATMIQFKLSDTVFFLLGLDDDGYTAQTYPSFASVSRDGYTASTEDAKGILDSLVDRGGDGGFEHSAAERRALNIAAAKLRAAIAEQS